LIDIIDTAKAKFSRRDEVVKALADSGVSPVALSKLLDFRPDYGYHGEIALPYLDKAVCFGTEVENEYKKW